MRKQKLFCSAIFMLLLAVTMPSARAQTFVVLHEFSGLDGALPEATVVRDAAGNLFGTTLAGGVGDGVVYKIDPTGATTVLFSFDDSNGTRPASALILDQQGNLYGTANGGATRGGVVFKVSPEGEETTLFAFNGELKHAPKAPSGALLLGKSGSLYGATQLGGSGGCETGCGTIYRLDASHKLHVLHSFTGGSDGSHPSGPLLQDAKGNLYGVTRAGGDLNCPEFPQIGCGTVFKLATNGALTVLHTFHGGAGGAAPQPGLLLDTVTGNLYGVTASGGVSEGGTAFQISGDGHFTTLHRFTSKNGTIPNGGLVSDPAGNLFGTTQAGGANALGTVFSLAPTGRLKVLHAFAGDLDGATPMAGLIRDTDGHLYGTAFKNLLDNQVDGDVFEIAP